MTMKNLFILTLLSYLSAASDAGTTYVRWGHRSCPFGVSLLYSGRASGAKWNEEGGTSDYLCLPDKPLYESAFTSGSSKLLGVEYQTWPHNNIQSGRENMPCALCFVSDRTAMFVQPASPRCPGGWTREYRGYLMSAAANNSGRRASICVERGALAIPGSLPNINPALAYVLSAECTNSELKCPPYVDERVLSCAVCTK